MKKGRSKERQPPSRQRYEKSNPTVSARVTVETRDKLRTVLPKLGMSLSDALKVLAGELEVKAISIDEAKRLGHEEAKRLYMVTHPCSICGHPISITSPKAKEAVSKYMVEQGWGHAKCHGQARTLQ
jgi:hypothetical protein